jgi:predicted 2-oxoglutarate/Fe(II)-dependent dioxygenase YbiX
MPSPEFFSQLGLFIRRKFFDAGYCASLITQMQASPQRLGGTYDGTRYVRDRKIRNVEESYLPDSMDVEIKHRVMTLKPQLESHFAVNLSGITPLQCNIYQDGGFIKPHQDVCPTDLPAPEDVCNRQVSFVIFLNGAESYGGGLLTFYELLATPQLKKCGLPLPAETGMLIAFRPQIVHGVTTVTHGERYTINSWLF